MGHALFIQDTYDVLICHIGHSKRGCRIIVVSKKGLALGQRAFVWLEDLGWGVGANPRGRGWGFRRGFGVVGCPV